MKSFYYCIIRITLALKFYRTL